MKASNFTTPRSLGDCQFIPSGDPIERPARHAGSIWSALGWAVVLAAVAAAVGTTLAGVVA